MGGWGRVLRCASITILGLLAGARGAGAQAAADTTVAVGVYIDCQGQAGFGCDQNYFRTEIVFVNWVTDRAVADVHLLVTAQQAGGGGRQYTLAFLGLRRFTGDDLQLSYASSGDATQDDIRRALADRFRIGLVRYAARTSALDRLRVTYSAPAASTGAPAQAVRDLWNFWVFTLGMNGNTNGESSTSFLNLSGNFNASRTTDAWKLSLGGNYNRQRNRYTLSDRKVIAINKNWGGNALVVKSLTDHVSAGARATVGSNSTQNQDLSTTLGTGFEYNIFPYRESTRRQFTFQYLITASHFEWADVTIFDKLAESHPGQTAVATMQLNQPWGNIRMNLSGNQYFHDLHKYNVTLGGNMQWRIFRGFSLNLNGNYTRVRDQLYIARGTLTDDQILTRQRQLATGYRYFGFFGINYRFGSTNNNVVNPRFGGDFGGGNFIF